MDLSHIPVTKRELYLGGRNARSEGKKTAPASVTGQALDWWMLGWQDRDQELNPARAVSPEEAAKLLRARAQAEKRNAAQKRAVRNRIADFNEERAMRRQHAEIWETETV